MVRRRQTKQQSADTPAVSLEKNKATTTATISKDAMAGTRDWSARTQWIFFAIASGACAAFNGVFAKLTTTELTTTLSKAVANALGLSSLETGVEVVVRALFFILNLVFNGVMWSLFTTALARGTSTTQVSIMNTSTNFIVTALLGFTIFSERLPPMWWGGAALLVAGSVITGRKDEDAAAATAAEGEYASVPQGEHRASQEGSYSDGQRGEEEEEDVIDLGDLTERR